MRNMTTIRFNKVIDMINPLPHREAFYFNTFTNRADPDLLMEILIYRILH